MLPTGLSITHRSRFTMANDAGAAVQSWTVIGRVLPLMLGRSDEVAQATVRRVQTCMIEIVEFARTRTMDDIMLCEVWLDAHHIFVAVDHTQPACTVDPSSRRCSLTLVQTVADDHGTHPTQDAYQTWASIPRG
ncbi:hypothetical protein [Streptomyces sp. NPDC004267]|uniref:hypothetical protein n=1 Tax=Streptomyces sp. NPDC004267 TaxID=3364694 RepID=UPI003688A17C